MDSPSIDWTVERCIASTMLLSVANVRRPLVLNHYPLLSLLKRSKQTRDRKNRWSCQSTSSAPRIRLLTGVADPEPAFQWNLENVVKVAKLWIDRSWDILQLLLPLTLIACCTNVCTTPRQETAATSSRSPVVYGSISRSVSDLKYSWGDVLQYRFQKIMSMQMFGKICAVLMAATPIVIVGGILYKVATGENLNDSLFKVYSVMSSIPGASAVHSENAVGLFLCSVVFFAGTFTVAVTLGIVCDDISNIVTVVRNGNYQIVESNHMVILNVNKRLRSVLSQIAEASKERGSFRCPIVVLDERDKEELDAYVSRAAEGLGLNVFTRSGCTHDFTNLRKVAVGRAKCIVWLEPDDTEVSVAARRASAIASMKVLGVGEDIPARIIVQTNQDSVKSKKNLTNVPLAFRSPPLKTTSKLNVVEVFEEENLDRFLAQCALQPHLSSILSDILQHSEGVEFYITQGNDFGGKTYGYARRYFTNAVVCGIHVPSKDNNQMHGAVELNPPEDTVLRSEDELVVLCNDLWNSKPSAKPLPEPSKWTTQSERQGTKHYSENIIVLCFGEEGYVDSGLVEALGRFASKPTKVTIVANSMEEKERNCGKCQLSYIEGDPSSFQTLRQLKKRKIDSIVFAGLEDLPPKVADAQLISSLIQIQEAANLHWDDRTGFNIVSPVNDPETRVVAEHLVDRGNEAFGTSIQLDVILPTELSSGVLVQVAGFPQLNLVFKSILCETGSELYIRNLDEFDLVDKGPIKFYELADLVRRYQETFLGVLKEDGSFFIAPNACDEWQFKPKEKLVVLADSLHRGKPLEIVPEIAAVQEEDT